MPEKGSPKCLQCDSTESLMWIIEESGNLCLNCNKKKTKKLELEAESSNNGASEPGTFDEKRLRKSTRATRFKNKTPAAAPVKPAPKGRSRRNIFKKAPRKTPVIHNTTHTAKSVFHKGSYIQVGDIVSVMDSDENTYYAQIHGLLVDIYCEKSAFLTWLIPTDKSPPPNEKFDPSSYLIGPEEDFARRLSCMEFVMHAPSHYFHDKTTPFPAPDIMDDLSNKGGFIWTTLKTVEKTKKTLEDTGNDTDEVEDIKDNDSSDDDLPIMKRRESARIATKMDVAKESTSVEDDLLELAKCNAFS